MKRLTTLLFLSLLFVFTGFAQDEIYSFDTKGGTAPVTMTTKTVVCGAPSTLTLVLTGTDPLCNGSADGSVSVSVLGGTPPYTYFWTPSSATTSTVTGLTANTYIVEVMDVTGGFSYCSGDIALVNPAPLIVNITPPTPVTTCFGACDGTATASGSGGTPPYTFLWSNGQTTATATGLCSQTYTVTATDGNGCTRTRLVAIGQPPILAHGGTTTSITCFSFCDGSADVNPSGGNPPYTYSWAPGGQTTSAITGQCVGSYTCNIVDSKNCAVTYTTTIAEPPQLTVSVSGTNLACNSVCDGTATASASGGIGAYTYNWSPGGYTTSSVTGLCANDYTITLTDANNCMVTATISITEPPPLTTTPTGNNITCFAACDGTADANAAGGTLPYTYAWLPVSQTTSAVSNLCNGTYTVVVADGNGCTALNTISLTQPALLTVTVSKTDETCAGACDGTGSATAAGGTTPYTYVWAAGGQTTTTATGLCPGNYTITVTDANNCTATNTITVSPPLAISPNLSSTTASCFSICDGSAMSSTSGGTAPYTYAWAPGGATTSSVTGLCAGNYTVNIVDAGGCTATGTVNVNEPALLSTSVSSASPNPLDCAGDCDGTVLTAVNGGTPAYTYNWNTGATTATLTGLCAGGYTLTVTDVNGCTATTSVTFTQPPSLTATVSTSNPTCNGFADGSISVSAGGGTGSYTYSWAPGGQTNSAITNQTAGNYTITVSDAGGCTNTQTVSLTEPAVLLANQSVVSNVSCAGLCDGEVTANPTGGTGAYTYLWTGGATTQSVTGLCAGSYNVLVQDANGCSDFKPVTVTQPVVLSSLISSAVSSCNLCTGAASVTTNGGTMPYTYAWAPGGQTTSTATGLCVGNYSVTITDANNCTNTSTVSITSQINLSVSTSGPSVSCAGSCDGIATANPSGGVLPYTYGWSTAPTQSTQTATGLCAGTYTVGVGDASGCITTATVSFTDPPALTTTMSSTSASCGQCNGTATVAAGGGTGSLSYSWSGFPAQTTTTATGLCPGDFTVTVTDANNCTTTNTVTVANIPVISDNPSVTLATCSASDGDICVSPTGGTPGYTYVWSPGGQTTACITDQPAGVYTVNITDNAGCTDDFVIPLNNISGPTITVSSQQDPVCNAGCDGSIAVSVAGSNPPFTYSWSTVPAQTTSAATGLCAGTHVVQVTDNISCISFATVTLTNPPQLNANPAISNVSCNAGSDGSICLAPSGGSSPYTYDWSPGGQTTSCITGLSAGNYTVILTDAIGCDDTVAYAITEPALLSLTVTGTDVTCNGLANGTASVTVSGGTLAYTYSWSTGSGLPSIGGQGPGNYTVTVTDANNCTASGTVTITEPTVLTSTISTNNISCNSLCDGDASLAVAGGTGAYTYAWSPGGQTTSTATGLCAGLYTGMVTDANGCTSSQTITISEPAAISSTITATPESCPAACDGSVQANVSGGTGAYTYLWSPGGATTSSVTGLCSGNYTLSITDANACASLIVVNVGTPAALQPNISSGLTSCVGSCDGFAASSATGGTGAYTYQWSNGASTSAITGLCAGTYTLILSDANGCSVSQTAVINSPNSLSQAVSVNGATCMLCNGSISVAASGGTAPYSYFWSTGETTATITGLCAGVYIDTVMDANGCLLIDTIGVSNTTGPTFNLAHTDVTCFGACDGTGTISGEAGNGPPWQYSWAFTMPTQTTAMATGLCPNQYFASVTDLLGCVTIDTINITEPADLAHNATVTNATCFGICDGSIVTAASGGTGAYTYNWAPGGQTTASITGQCAGNYTLTLTDANSCLLTSTFTIGQNTILSSSVSSTNVTCNSFCDGTASITVSGGTLPYTYAWNPAVATSSSTTGLCPNTYTVNISDASGCVNVATVTITEPAALTGTLSATNPTCTSLCNGNITITASGGTLPYTYMWSPGGATGSAISNLCAGSNTVSLTDGNGCQVTYTVALTDPAPLALTYTVTDLSCTYTGDGAIDLTVTGGTGAYTYTWSNLATTQDVSNLTAGSYSVLVSDANGCTSVASMTVGVTTVVTAAASNDTSFCIGGTATLVSSSINATGITWYQLPGWTNLGTTTTITVTPAAGVTDYALIAINGVCSDTDSVAVTVNTFPVTNAGSDVTICSGGSTSLCASGATTYQWYELPLWTPIATGTCTQVSPPLGNNNYAVIGMNGTCSDTDSVVVVVVNSTIADAGPDTSTCSGNGVTLCGTNSQFGTLYSWYELPGWTLVDTTICINVSPGATTDYALIHASATCSDTDTVTVTIFQPPTANAGPDATILASGSVVLSGSGSGTYLWTPSTGLSSSSVANPTANPSVTTTYTLLVTDANGCTAVDSVKITIVNEVVPNDGISPNGDGINDILEIPNIQNFPGALVEIYNRWGQLLFSTTDYPNNKWDGKYNGSDLPVGTYYYVINLNSSLNPEPLTGPITILR